jgi:nitrate reductase NapE component
MLGFYANANTDTTKFFILLQSVCPVVSSKFIGAYAQPHSKNNHN